MTEGDLLVRLLDRLPDVLRRWAEGYTLPESQEHLALIDAADALDDALDLVGDQE